MDRGGERHAVEGASVLVLKVANVLAMSLRRKLLMGAKIAQFRELLARLRVRLEPHEHERPLGPVLSLSQKHGLTSYDAANLEMAKRLTLPQASLDTALKAAAKAEGVELFEGRLGQRSALEAYRRSCCGGPSVGIYSDLIVGGDKVCIDACRWQVAGFRRRRCGCLGLPQAVVRC